jgi:hypothetical protein
MADQDMSEQVVEKDIRGDMTTGKFREHIATKKIDKHGAAVATKNKVDVPTELHARIKHALKTRSARRGTMAARLEDRLKDRGLRAWAMIEKRPLSASVVLAGTGLAVGTALGVAELTLGLFIGYSAYQVLREGVPPREAAERIFGELEHELP